MQPPESRDNWATKPGTLRAEPYEITGASRRHEFDLQHAVQKNTFADRGLRREKSSSGPLGPKEVVANFIAYFGEQHKL